MTITTRQWLLLCLMALAAGISLAFCLRQIRQEREIREQALPAANEREIREVPGGIQFEL